MVDTPRVYVVLVCILVGLPAVAAIFAVYTVITAAVAPWLVSMYEQGEFGVLAAAAAVIIWISALVAFGVLVNVRDDDT